MLRCTHLKKQFGTLDVITDADFVVGRGQKFALVGANGTGKSTLLKMIAGLEEPSEGHIDIQDGIRVEYLAQEVVPNGAESVREYFGRRTSSAADEAEAESVAAGLGITPETLGRPLRELSGGQKAKVALAVALARRSDLLLLDEPTNNIDLRAVEWLEDFLRASSSAVIVISHDREFLSRVTEGVLAIDWFTRKVARYGGSYDDYLREAERARERQVEAYDDYRSEQRRLTGLSRDIRQWGDKAGRAHISQSSDNDKHLVNRERERGGAMLRRARIVDDKLTRLEAVESPREKERLVIELSSERGGMPEIEAVAASWGYDGFTVGPVSLRIAPGKRIAIVGENGSGKTTLLKGLTGELSPLAGEVRRSASIVIGNLMQEHENLPRKKTVAEFLVERTGADRTTVFHTAVEFGLSREQVASPIYDLSPGGRTRLLLATFALQHANLLVLDEPTNHLDEEAVDALETALATYRGGVIVVTHDRRFLKALAPTETVTVRDGQVSRE